MSDSGNTLLLYKKIEVLNRDAHKNLRLNPSADCGFAADTHLVPLAAGEFVQAARTYPIFFVGEGGNLGPIALLGLKPGENNFVDAGGKWASNTYIPAFVRRYPFVPAQQGEGFTICFDSECKGWSQTEGEALFDAEGKNTPFLDEVVRFLDSSTQEAERTRMFVAKLNELGLLVERNLQLGRPEADGFTLRDFKTVDEEKLANLDDAQIVELHRKGYLTLIHAHLFSLGNAGALFERHLAAKTSTH